MANANACEIRLFAITVPCARAMSHIVNYIGIIFCPFCELVMLGGTA